jgi:hypothetical protein
LGDGEHRAVEAWERFILFTSSNAF